MKVGAKKKSATGGTIEKTATGIKHTAGKNYSGKAAEKEEKSKKDESKMMPKGKKRPVAESVETAMTFREMMKLVVESGGQQQIDPIDSALFAWAQRVAASKYTESTKAEVFAGMLYERNGGVFEMYDVLSEDQK
jgi:iron only hydrogenase large subunit-like protein